MRKVYEWVITHFEKLTEMETRESLKTRDANE